LSDRHALRESSANRTSRAFLTRCSLGGRTFSLSLVRADPEVLIAERDRAGIFIDFDGTLSHIVDVPSEARPAGDAVATLERLAASFSLVAIVSGRSASELMEWLGPDLEIWGVHGAERAHGGEVALAPGMESYLPLLQHAKRDAESAIAHPGFEGCLVEDKTVALALHHRMATRSDAADRLRDLADRLAGAYGLTRTDAKMAFELRPPVDVSKRSVILARARGLGLTAAAFLGDDVVDLAAFDALDELEREGLHVLRVAVESEEAPAELIERADVVVQGVAGDVEWLIELARRAAAE
jgi:trehalose 6-phosphate phosphatase